MAQRSIKRLEEFHKDLYQRAFRQASVDPLLDAPAIIKYSESFYESLPKTFKKTSICSLLKELDRSSFLLYGDFHTLKQTQKGLIRILREYVRYNPERNITLALEMFRADHQNLLDQFQRGEISEHHFLDSCRYDSTWGFPWENYKIIVDFALTKSIKIVGINANVSGANQLSNRDRFAASILADLNKRDPKGLCVCMIGEYHLADKHLPALLDRNAKTTRILTNIDHYYFLSSDYHQTSATEYLQLKKGLYCVLNSPPWIKWQSYSLWEEMKSIQDFDDEETNPHILYTEESFDLDYQILNLLTHITEFLGLTFHKNELTRFNAFLDPTEKDLEQILKHRGLNHLSVDQIQERLDQDSFFFIPTSQTIIISEISLNAIAEVAGQFLFNLLHPAPNDEHSLKRFCHQCLMASSGVLASKILNPRRRCRDRTYYHNLIEHLKRRRLIGSQKRLRETSRYLVTLLDRLHQGKPLKITHSMLRWDDENHFELSTRLGRVLGYETYKAIMKSSNSTLEFNQFFQFSTDNLEPNEQLDHIIQCIEPID